MMLLSSTILLLSALSTSAIPSSGFASVLTHSNSALRNLPFGKTPISRSDMKEIARLAATVNQAYCPLDTKIQPPSDQNKLQPVRHQRRQHNKHDISVVTSSTDPEFAHLSEEVDMSWYISHTPATHTLTLAFSSLSSVDDFLDLLSSDPESGDAMIDLPNYLFPHESLPVYPPPQMHHSHLAALETHGTSALLALLDLIETPPSPPTKRDMLNSIIASINGGELNSTASKASNAIQNVEIVGHGLGASVAMLVALALDLEVSGPAATAYTNPLPSVTISAALFSLPRVGDQVFADWVDTLLSSRSTLSMHRITSYADTIPHLPARHQALAHPSVGELWIGADPRTGYTCVAEAGTESSECSASIELPKSSLVDHAGPFAGVWIGKGTCRKPRKMVHQVSEVVVMLDSDL